MRALLLSAYAAQSHVHWRRGLQAMFPDWSWTVLELPPRFFSWRVRGNPLSWLDAPELKQQYDVIIATSMVDLATLRGTQPTLAGVPCLYYFHENQFDYPSSDKQSSLLEAQMVSIYGAIATEALAFNSQYNLDTFFIGCEALLKRFPDQVPAGVVAALQQKSSVLPVPLLPGPLRTGIGLQSSADSSDLWHSSGNGRALRILWSARFEYDKGGEQLQAILRHLEKRHIDFELALTGQQFRHSPPVFGQIQDEFKHRLVQFGFVENAAQFEALQGSADVVLSTAEHEFQGLAVLQAVAAGCVPVVPDRLAYREIFAFEYRYRSTPADKETEVVAAADKLCAIAAELSRGPLLPPSVKAYELDQLRPHYTALLAQLSG